MQKHTVKGWLQLARPPVNAHKYEKIEFEASVNAAIEVMEKHVPKKEKHNNCPSCGTSNRFIIENLGNPKGHPVVYCWNCGQAIDWRDE